MQEILFYSYQYGVTTAFAELAKVIHDRLPETKVHLYTGPMGKKLYDQSGLAANEVGSFAELEKIHRHLTKPSLIISDTTGDVDHVRDLWAWGKSLSIPIVAFIDQWSYMEDRFRGDVVPDHVLVVDEAAAELARARAGKALSIEIVGHPYLSYLKKKGASFQALHAKKNTHRVLLLTEPFPGPAYEKSFREEFGFSEHDYLSAALDGLAASAKNFQRPWQISLRPHPRDDQKRLTALMNDFQIRTGLTWKLSTLEKEEAFAQADLVLGMCSMFLLEASLFGVPALSLQPHRKKGQALTDDRENLLVCTDPALTPSFIEKALSKTGISGEKHKLIPENSSQLFVNVIKSILREKKAGTP